MKFNPKALVTKNMLMAYVAIALGLSAAFGVSPKYVCSIADFFSDEPIAACVTQEGDVVNN